MREVFISISQIFDNDFKGACDMCGVCCTHVSINSTLPNGTQFTKPAGEKCRHLTSDNLCSVWGDETQQPSVCRTIQPTNSLCRFDLRGNDEGTKHHIEYLHQLEELTVNKTP